MHFNFYNTDLSVVAVQILPIKLRKGVLIAIVYAFAYMITLIKKEHDAWRINNYRKTRVTAQVFSLQSLLNDLYSPTSRLIKITDGENAQTITPLYLRQVYKNEKQPIWTTPTFIYKQSSGIEGGGVDFYVKVPSGVLDAYTTDNAFKQSFDITIINNKLAGKTYKVVSL